MIGFVANEIAAPVRLRGRRRLASPALIAAGNHARIDGAAALWRLSFRHLVLWTPRCAPVTVPCHSASCVVRMSDARR